MAGLTFEQLKALNPSQAPMVDAACPACGPNCKAEINRRRKVLRIWDEGDFASYKCARCEIAGWARGDASHHHQVKERAAPTPPQTKAMLARFLWAQSQPLERSPAEAYLRSRGCFAPSPNLRFLPARQGHPPAMVARFGAAEEKVTGVHLTKLQPDGRGKAGTETDKLVVGASVGQPIVVHDDPEREELIITEGIEDAASFAIVTGWPTWAAGSAGRIPQVLAAAAAFPKVYCAVDLDFGKKMRAGPRAFDKGRAIREDLIPLRIEKALGFREKLDANRALVKFGAEAVLAAIEWCENQHRFARGEIGFNALQAANARATKVFAGLSGQ